VCFFLSKPERISRSSLVAFGRMSAFAWSGFVAIMTWSYVAVEPSSSVTITFPVSSLLMSSTALFSRMWFGGNPRMTASMYDFAPCVIVRQSDLCLKVESRSLSHLSLVTTCDHE